MPAPTQPSEIAREVLRLFAARRLPPTPDNFRDLYHEVAGTTDESGAAHEHLLRELASRLPVDTPERLRLTRQLQRAISDKKRSEAEAALFDYLQTIARDEVPAWNSLIGTLLRQWDARQLGWTTARKRESLERVLAANDPSTLYTRLNGLVKAWSQAPTDPELPVADGVRSLDTIAAASAPAVRPEVQLVAQGEAQELIDKLRTLLLTTLETVIPAVLGEHPELVAEAAGFASSVRTSREPAQFEAIGTQLRKFAYRLELTAADDGEVRAGLLNLLRLLLENIEEIVVDNRWLKGQVEVLRDVVARPTNVRLIDDAERRLRELIYKQSQLKHSLTQAQDSLRTLLAGFFDQLAHFSRSTGHYHDRISSSAQRIAQAKDISEISHVLDEVMRETRQMQEDTQRSREELESAQERARQAEQRIAELQVQLDEASHLMRHDQLTGALNRRGLEEIFDKEAARALRRNAPLCVALLDIDNFKRLNDTYGHRTGDDALIHLTRVIRGNIRPEDTVARLGGEEFIIVYPEADLDQATTALVRLQRELTKTYFLADDQKLLITFSAGVSLWEPGEAMDGVINRADEAMYEAKQSGKNKVVATSPPPPPAPEA